MSLHSISPTDRTDADPLPVLFRYGFRPFFLAAGLSAAGFLAAWLAVLVTGTWPDGPIGPSIWHAHEMLFGFSAAAVAGFLLTAVPSWTGTVALSGRPLMLLAVLWLAGRVAVFPWAGVPAPAAALLDLAFFPALGVALARPLIRAGKLRNSAFLVLLVLLFLANLLIHLEWMAVLEDGGARGLALAIGVVLMMVAVIGGRILPAFTRNGLAAQRIPATVVSRPWVERVTLASTAALIPATVLIPDAVATGLLALVAAAAHGVRLFGWQGWKARRQPILWVLHVGYLWVVAGLALTGLHLVGDVVPASSGIHALTAGAFGTMILAVMSRAALGHTGRPLVAAPLTVGAYWLVTAAALLRVASPLLPAGLVWPALLAAGVVWVAAFALFLAVYAPILLTPRADGRPG
ncbi:NnrS family protein [Azospirillum thermophilum]|uniref:NnrS family protein n=1 Tax=Azospirillum thermophilum TaxID=2202148 RepID=A0A2S2CZF5_9PROT|nr:NnrS family protein [Azospirillum thermophilum]AWK89903.1 NnrS family protein [Azospirillum thermophilum]